MGREAAERLIVLLRESPEIDTVDFTGGAPELNPHFRWLVEEARRLDRRVLDRCNLTVLFEPGLADLPEFLAAHGVEIVASLPCYSAENVEKQRGRGAFDESIRALRRLNELGYGRPGSDLRLTLVYNPVGPSLPPAQVTLEAKYKEELARLFGIEFHDLLTITNMPIARFAHALERENHLEEYMALLVNHFNVDTVSGLMCRSLVSVSWDGKLHDCDFNQMLEIPLGSRARTIWDVDSFAELRDAPIATASHCFGCTAGAGSSCSGALR
jgi:radical SAM/Cys-rich protein